MKHIKSVVCTVVIGLILVAHLMSPAEVYADGETPPTPTNTVAVTSTPVPTDTPTQVIPAETPTPLASASPTTVPVDTGTLAPEATATPELIVTTVVPVNTDTSTPEPPTEIVETITLTLDPTATTPAPTDVPAIDQPTLLETIQTIPGDPSVVVLDENSQPLSLASQAAADVIANSDPMWCPSAVTPGGEGCTASYTTVTDLISNLAGESGAGTIYFTSTYFTNDVTFDHTDPNLSNLTDLVIQGGWNGLTGGSYALSGYSVFTVPISITNWNNSVTVNNVDIQNTLDLSDAGLDISSNGAVTINHSNFTNNYVGTYIQTNGDVTVEYSNFFNNGWDGLQVFTTNDTVETIAIQNSTFSYNNRNYSDGYGTWLVADSYDIASVTNSTYVNNYAGLVANTDVNITNSTFNLNCLDISTSSIFQSGNYCGAPLPPPEATPVPVYSAVDVQDDEVFSLDCGVSDRTYLKNLPNGDLVEIHCPAVGDASIVRLDSTTLPGDLPDGYTYASAFEVDIKQGEIPIPVIEQGGYIRASFIASYLQQGSDYDILYWDAWEVEDGKLVPLETGKWVPLKDFILQAKGPRSFNLDPATENLVERKIISGVRLLPKNTDERVEVTINFPGIFVLVQH